jgi:hypothetical protein
MRRFRMLLAFMLVITSACTSMNKTRTATLYAPGVRLPQIDSITAVVGKSDSLVLPFNGPGDWTKLVWLTQVGTAIRIKSYELYSLDIDESSTNHRWNLVIHYVGRTRGWSYLTFEPDGYPAGSTMITVGVIKPYGEIRTW